jgi:hypothetical protein
MSFLKKLLGTTDAMAEARKAVPAAGGSAPHGWNVTSPEVEQTDTEVILRMDDQDSMRRRSRARSTATHWS